MARKTRLITMTDTKKKTVEATPAGNIATAAATAKKDEGSILTPAQSIGIFTEAYEVTPEGKKTAKELKSLYETILDGFSAEGQSKIAIGRAMNEARVLLGETFGKFLQDCVVKALRKSSATCYNYMALATAAVHQFGANKVVADAVFRIWSAEGCFDTQNGELKPVVKEAIGAAGGIPESTDSAACEAWARHFVNLVDQLVAKTRKAQPGGRKWDAKMVQTKAEELVKKYVTFLNKTSSKGRKPALTLLTAIVIKSLTEGLEIDAVNEAFDAGLEHYKNKVEKEARDHQKAA
jgi:hypothetical protein